MKTVYYLQLLASCVMLNSEAIVFNSEFSARLFNDEKKNSSFRREYYWLAGGSYSKSVLGRLNCAYPRKHVIDWTILHIRLTHQYLYLICINTNMLFLIEYLKIETCFLLNKWFIRDYNTLITNLFTLKTYLHQTITTKINPNGCFVRE